MRNIWIISDTHFGHENIIRYCNRPFQNAKEMDEQLIENWNSVVKDGDIVYHLGDVYMGNSGRDAISKLKGRKRLVLGNHDIGKDQFLHKHFQKIMMWRMFPEFGLLLTHVPVDQSALERHEVEGVYYLTNVHGHIHNKTSPTLRHVNVSVEMINYTPIHIDELKMKG